MLISVHPILLFISGISIFSIPAQSHILSRYAQIFLLSADSCTYQLWLQRSVSINLFDIFIVPQIVFTSYLFLTLSFILILSKRSPAGKWLNPAGCVLGGYGRIICGS